jgi:NADPH:quinone reductase-like Zn-dependent oxidoreductase
MTTEGSDMARAIQFDRYGGLEVLHVAEVEVPRAEPGQVVVKVRAAGMNPGEVAIRSGAMEEQFPATFPSGQGSDFAGFVTEVGDGVDGFSVNDEVIGWSEQRSSQADYVAVPADQVVAKPGNLDWPTAGALYVAGVTAQVSVGAVAAQAEDTVVVSAAAGGVGSITVQLLKVRGARVIGIASERHHDWLRSVGVTPIAYGDGLADRIREVAPGGVDAFIDTYGPEYVELAAALGVKPDRINTIIAFDAAKQHGAKAAGSQSAEDPAAALAEVAAHVANGRIRVPIAATYDLEQVRDAYAQLEERHTEGKIVLLT